MSWTSHNLGIAYICESESINFLFLSKQNRTHSNSKRKENNICLAYIFFTLKIEISQILRIELNLSVIVETLIQVVDCAQGLVTTYLSSKNFDLPYTISIGEVKIFRRQIGRDEPLHVDCAEYSCFRHF